MTRAVTGARQHIRPRPDCDDVILDASGHAASVRIDHVGGDGQVCPRLERSFRDNNERTGEEVARAVFDRTRQSQQRSARLLRPLWRRGFEY